MGVNNFAIAGKFFPRWMASVPPRRQNFSYLYQLCITHLVHHRTVKIAHKRRPTQKDVFFSCGPRITLRIVPQFAPKYWPPLDSLFKPFVRPQWRE